MRYSNAELKNLVSQVEMTVFNFLTVIQMLQIGRQNSTHKGLWDVGDAMPEVAV